MNQWEALFVGVTPIHDGQRNAVGHGQWPATRKPADERTDGNCGSHRGPVCEPLSIGAGPTSAPTPEDAAMPDHHTTQSGSFQPDHLIPPIPAGDGAPIPTTPAALLQRISGEYPVIARCQPLKIGIHEALYQALPGASRTLVRKVLAFHCGSRRYLEALAAGGARYALDGSPSGEVTDAHRVAAVLVLSRRAEKATPSRRAGPQRTRGAASAEAPARTNVSPRPILRLRRRA